MIDVLYAIGKTNGSAEDIKKTDLSVNITLTSTVKEALQEIKSNPLKYKFILICAKSFYETDGKNFPEIMEELKTHLITNKDVKLCFIDYDATLQPEYSTILGGLNNTKYTNLTNITLRIFKTVLRQFLEGELGNSLRKEVSNPIPKEIPKNEIKQKEIKIKKSFFGSFTRKSKKELEVNSEQISKVVEEIKNKPKLQEPVQEPQNTGEDKLNNDNIVSVDVEEDVKIDETVDVEEQVDVKDTEEPKENIIQQEPAELEEDRIPQEPEEIKEEIITKEIVKDKIKNENKEKIDYTKFNKNIILIIGLNEGVGATTFALQLSKCLADNKHSVTYIELTSDVSTSHAIISSEETYQQIEETDSLNMVYKNPNKINSYIEVYKNITLLRNSPCKGLSYDNSITKESALPLLINNIKKSEDIVIVDVDIETLIRNQMLLTIADEKLVVTNNTPNSILKSAITLTKLKDNMFNVDTDLLYQSITNDSKFIINKADKYLDDKEVIKPREVLSYIVNINSELDDVELCSVIGAIPYSLNIANNCLSKENLKEIENIIRRIK